MNESDCQPCTKGTYKGLFEAKCNPCPERKTTVGTGSTKVEQCTENCGDNYVGSNGECTKNCIEGEIVVDGRCYTCGSN